MIWLEHCVWSPNRPTLVASHFGKYSTEQKKTPLQEKVVTPKICDKSMKHLNLHEGSQCFVSNSILAENQQILVENHLSAPWKFVKKHQPTKLKPLKHLKKTRPPPTKLDCLWVFFLFSWHPEILGENIRNPSARLSKPWDSKKRFLPSCNSESASSTHQSPPVSTGLLGVKWSNKKRLQRRWFDWWSCKKTAVKFKFNNLFRQRTFFLPKIYNLGDTFSTKSHLMTVEASPRVALKAVANKNPMPCWNIGGHPNRGHCLLWHWICVPSRCSWRCGTFGFPDLWLVDGLINRLIWNKQNMHLRDSSVKGFPEPSSMMGMARAASKLQTDFIENHPDSWHLLP